MDGSHGYLLCGSARTGSTLLCGLLTSSGVAGRPASYFNRRTVERYAEEWGIAPRLDVAFVRAARAAGSTPNGVFGGRLMAESLPDLVGGLAADPASGEAADDLELLTAHLGQLRFVHLRRADVVGQAVSWAKALQTHRWHPHEEVEPGGRPAEYDEELIAAVVRRIEAAETTWRTWFGRHGVEPCEVTYEELAADPVGTARRVLGHLDLDAPAGSLVVGHRRQADGVNADWVTRFRGRPRTDGPR